jgi:hypothetical protein
LKGGLVAILLIERLYGLDEPAVLHASCDELVSAGLCYHGLHLLRHAEQLHVPGYGVQTLAFLDQVLNARQPARDVPAAEILMVLY